mmetsp:Transcript_9376/g.30836  ORF Transcript_9376/g.30836 Transcript_9376/m.30836 type:complete len:484 (-) Transcript_9376:18-1469(-)
MEALPDDALTNIATFLVGGYPIERRKWAEYETLKHSTFEFMRENYAYAVQQKRSRTDVLNVRGVSVAFRDSVRAALRARASKDTIVFEPPKGILEDPPVDSVVDPRIISAVGAVYGVTFNYLLFTGKSSVALDSVSSFVANTSGRLERITVQRSAISAERFLDICRACPRLRALRLLGPVPEIKAKWLDIAESVARACPHLTELDGNPFMSSADTSGAESWEMHFPELDRLTFGTVRSDSRAPVDFQGIEQSALRCSKATECCFRNCCVSPGLMECILRTSLCARLQHVNFDNVARISEETIVACAAGCHQLRSIQLPNICRLDATSVSKFQASFYVSLFDARPELEYIAFPSSAVFGFNDACFEAICRFSLNDLALNDAGALSPGSLVDTILSHPCSRTLKFFSLWRPQGSNFYNWDFIAPSDLLKLVEGCPLLLNFSCDANSQLFASSSWATSPKPEFHDDVCRAKIILKKRGGSFEVEYS